MIKGDWAIFTASAAAVKSQTVSRVFCKQKRSDRGPLGSLLATVLLSLIDLSRGTVQRNLAVLSSAYSNQTNIQSEYH